MHSTHTHTGLCVFGEFHRTDYFLEREFCTHHAWTTITLPSARLPFHSHWNCFVTIAAAAAALFFLAFSCHSFFFVFFLRFHFTFLIRLFWFVAIRVNFPFQVAQGVQDTLLSVNLFNVDLPTQKEVISISISVSNHLLMISRRCRLICSSKRSKWTQLSFHSKAMLTLIANYCHR